MDERSRRGVQGLGGAARRGPTMTVRRARQLALHERRARLEQLLRETGGNVAEIARRLNRDPSTVRYHLARCGLMDDPDGGGAD